MYVYVYTCTYVRTCVCVTGALVLLWSQYSRYVHGPVQDGGVGLGVGQVWVVRHSPQDLQHPRGAALWVGHHNQVIGAELRAGNGKKRNRRRTISELIHSYNASGYDHTASYLLGG